MAANKVVFGNKVLIDLTGDTVTEEALLKGYTAHKADGANYYRNGFRRIS